MTPKEKAEELVFKFTSYVSGFTAQAITLHAKVCASICVKEIIFYYPVAKDDERSKKFNEYWEEVLRAIENL